MRVYHRKFIFEGNDFDNMCKFIIRDNANRKNCFIWDIGRLVDWKYNLSNFKKHFPDNFSYSAHLWFDYFHELIGFVISEGFDNEFISYVRFRALVNKEGRRISGCEAY